MRQQWRLAALVAIGALALAGCTTAGRAGAGQPSSGSTGPSQAPSLGQLEVIAPAKPGSGWDQTARAVASVLESEDLVDGTTVTNVPGASGTIALAQVAGRSGDDGVLIASGLAMLSGVLTNSADVTFEAMTPIARLIGESELIVVPADSEFQTIEQLLAAIKADPASVAIAGGSAGSADHVFLGLLADANDIAPADVNFVPFSGGGEAATALLGKQVDAGIAGVGEFAELVSNGSLRPLLVSTSEAVDGIEAPTIVDAGFPELEFANWRSIMAPADISEERRQQYLAAIDTVIASSAWEEQRTKNQWLDQYLAGDEFEVWLQEETARVSSVLDDLGLVVGQ